MMKAFLTAGVVVAGLAGMAHGTTITTANGTASCYAVGTMNSVACRGYLFGVGGDNDVPGILSGSLADVWDIKEVTGSPANSENNEANLLNAVTGSTMFVGGDMDKVGGNGGSQTFLLDQLYVLLKIGAGHVIIRNDADEAIDIAWLAGTSGGLSHHTQAGDLGGGINPPPIPLPAAAWLLLSGIGGLGVMGWRKRRADA